MKELRDGSESLTDDTNRWFDADSAVVVGEWSNDPKITGTARSEKVYYTAKGKFISEKMTSGEFQNTYECNEISVKMVIDFLEENSIEIPKFVEHCQEGEEI